MNKSFYIILLLLASCTILSGQKKATVTVKSESSYEQLLPGDMIYEFSEFAPAKLYFDNKGIAEHQVNYNLVSGALLFKDKSGRVLEYTYPDQIKTFVIRDTFWVGLKEGFGRIVYSTDNIDIIKYRRTECTDIRKEGAFGGVSPTSSSTSYSTLQGGGGKSYNLSTPGEYDFEVKVFYYIRRNDEVLPVSVKNLKKLFPGKKNAVSGIMKTRRLDLTKEKDIISLVRLVSSDPQ